MKTRGRYLHFKTTKMARTFSLSIILIFSLHLQAQTSLTLEQCEAKFVKNNFSLLSAQYNIDAAKALTIQAKLWENPVISSELNAINPTNNKSFDIGKNGQKAIAIQQLIYMGGKKQKQIEIARLNEQLAILEFQDLLRNLKFQLRQTFYNIYFNQERIATAGYQINNLDSLVNSYASQSKKGNVPIKDYVRLQALLVDLNNQKMELLKNNTEQLSKMSVLLGDSTSLIPSVPKEFLNKYIQTLNLNVFDLEQIATQERPDIKINEEQVQGNILNVGLQKAMRVPDLNLGTAWDQHGGAFNNQVNLTLGVALPIWNRNKGNIKNAEVLVSQSKLDRQAAQFSLNAEVQMAYKNWLDVQHNYKSLSNVNSDNYDSVYIGIVENFRKGNINILDFTDFIESYNQLKLHINELKQNVVMTSEVIITVVNKDVFKN